MQEYCIKISSNISFGYLLELPHRGDSDKYLKHMFYEEIKIKQGLSYIFYPLRILYNSKFYLMATSLGKKCYRWNEGLLYLDDGMVIGFIRQFWAHLKRDLHPGSHHL